MRPDEWQALQVIIANGATVLVAVAGLVATHLNNRSQREWESDKERERTQREDAAKALQLEWERTELVRGLYAECLEKLGALEADPESQDAKKALQRAVSRLVVHLPEGSFAKANTLLLCAGRAGLDAGGIRDLRQSILGLWRKDTRLWPTISALESTAGVPGLGE